MSAVLIAACVVVAAVWVRLVIRTRRRARARAEETRALQAQFEQTQRAQEAAELKQRAWRAQYRREMAARSMDRFNGHRKPEPDPTFEQWLAAKGYREDVAS